MAFVAHEVDGEGCRRVVWWNPCDLGLPAWARGPEETDFLAEGGCRQIAVSGGGMQEEKPLQRP